MRIIVVSWWNGSSGGLQWLPLADATKVWVGNLVVKFTPCWDVSVVTMETDLTDRDAITKWLDENDANRELPLTEQQETGIELEGSLAG